MVIQINIQKNNINMIKIYIQTNWTSPGEIRHLFNQCTINSDYKWNDLVMVDNYNDCDFNIIFNTPYKLNNNYDKNRTIVFCCEPISTRQIFASQYNFDPYKHKNDWYYFYDTPNHHNLDKWYISLNYKQLLEENRFEKTKILSSVISGSRGLVGHEYRINFVKLLDNLSYYDNYGRGCPFPNMKHYRGAIINKEDGLLKYKYTFNCENTPEPGYFTEKFIDPILCETLCFYFGCPNLNKFFDPMAYIWVDITKPREALNTIISSINNNEWEKRIDYIRKEKKKLMTTLNPLNIIESIIKYKKPPYDL